MMNVLMMSGLLVFFFIQILVNSGLAAVLPKTATSPNPNRRNTLVQNLRCLDTWSWNRWCGFGNEINYRTCQSVCECSLLGMELCDTDGYGVCNHTVLNDICVYQLGCECECDDSDIGKRGVATSGKRDVAANMTSDANLTSNAVGPPYYFPLPPCKMKREVNTLWTSDSNTTIIGVFTQNGHLNFMRVPNNGTLFPINNTISGPIERVCVQDTVACAVEAKNGTWFAVYKEKNNDCVDITPNQELSQGFCCDNLDNCAILPPDHRLMPRGGAPTNFTTPDTPIVLLFKGAGGSRGWDVHDMDYVPFNTTTTFAPTQVCIENAPYAACAFANYGPTKIFTVMADINGGCVTIAPPAVLVSGICCADRFDCVPPKRNKLALVDGNQEIAAILPNVFSKALTTDIGTSMAFNPITIQYFGSSGEYGFEIITGPGSIPGVVPWAVTKICLVSAEGYCYFFSESSTDYIVVEAGTCQPVGPPRVLYAAVCCSPSDGCDEAPPITAPSVSAREGSHMAEPALAIRDATSTVSTAAVAFHGATGQELVEVEGQPVVGDLDLSKDTTLLTQSTTEG